MQVVRGGLIASGLASRSSDWDTVIDGEVGYIARAVVQALTDAGLLPTETEWAIRRDDGSISECEDRKDAIACATWHGLDRTIVSRNVTPWIEATS